MAVVTDHLKKRVNGIIPHQTASRTNVHQNDQAEAEVNARQERRVTVILTAQLANRMRKRMNALQNQADVTTHILTAHQEVAATVHQEVANAITQTANHSTDLTTANHLTVLLNDQTEVVATVRQKAATATFLIANHLTNREIARTKQVATNRLRKLATGTLQNVSHS